ncbi:hypothetical protein BDAP_002423 [Binucleata daphniae]
MLFFCVILIHVAVPVNCNPTNPLQITIDNGIPVNTDDMYCNFLQNKHENLDAIKYFNNLENKILGKVCDQNDGSNNIFNSDIVIYEENLNIQKYMCNVDNFVAKLEEAGCIQKYKLILFANASNKTNDDVELRDIFRNIISQNQTMLNNFEDIIKYASVNELEVDHTNLLQNAQTNNGVKENDKKCANVNINIVLDKEGEKRLKTALKIASLISAKKDDGTFAFMQWENLDKISLEQFICPSNLIVAVLTEIGKFIDLLEQFICINKLAETRKIKNKVKLEKHIIIKNVRLKFLIGYIDLLDHCIICVKGTLECTLKGQDLQPTKWNVCRYFKPEIYNSSSDLAYKGYNDIRSKYNGQFVGSKKNLDMQTRNHTPQWNVDFVDKHIDYVLRYLKKTETNKICERFDIKPGDINKYIQSFKNANSLTKKMNEEKIVADEPNQINRILALCFAGITAVGNFLRSLIP